MFERQKGEQLVYIKVMKSHIVISIVIHIWGTMLVFVK